MFKKLVFGVLSIIMTLTLVVAVPTLEGKEHHRKTSTPSNVSSQEMGMIIQVVQTIDALHQDKSDAVWQGYDLAETPIILTFNNGHIYAFNFKSNDTTWQHINLNGSEVLYTDKDKWGLVEVHMQPKFKIEGQEAFVFHFDMMQMDPYMPFLVLVHERFHQHQFNHFILDDEGLKSGYSDHLNADNLALMQLEELILVDFLRNQGNNLQELQQKRDTLKDFAAIHEARKGLLQADSVRWEQIQQSMEGLADYVSMKTYEVHHILPGYFSQMHLLQTMQGYTHDDNISDRAIKWRHYGVGASLGFALDFLKVPSWKRQVEEKDIALDDLLASALNLSKTELNQRVAAVKQKYGYDTIRKHVGNTVETYEHEVNSSMEKFDAMDGVNVTLERPQDISISGGGSNRHLYYLSDGSTLALEESSVNRTMDNLWNVSFEREPFVFQSGEGAREFKVEKDLKITLDGKTYQLRELLASNQEIAFNTISWEGKRCMFLSEQHAGKLSVQAGKLTIAF